MRVSQVLLRPLIKPVEFQRVKLVLKQVLTPILFRKLFIPCKSLQNMLKNCYVFCPFSRKHFFVNSHMFRREVPALHY